MTMASMELKYPEQAKEYIVDGTSEIAKNALLIYPSIVCNKISHGKAAELLGIKKIELIQLYGRLGISYIDMSDEEFEEEMETVRKFRKEKV